MYTDEKVGKRIPSSWKNHKCFEQKSFSKNRVSHLNKYKRRLLHISDISLNFWRQSINSQKLIIPSNYLNIKRHDINLSVLFLLNPFFVIRTSKINCTYCVTYWNMRELN